MSTATRNRLPRVAIVGRPNVGKSTLANRMCGSRVSIVEPTAGVTRDRVAIPARLTTASGEHWMEVIDTGGIGIVDRDDLGPQVEEQIKAALASADLVLWLVDVRDGITPLDQEVARRLRGIPLPVLLVANKAEGRKYAWDVDDFRRLGVAEGPFAISAQNGEGLEPLYERIVELLPPCDEALDVKPEPVMKLAVVGQRNAGKSTLINGLAREVRMIVSEIPGTTRDAVDVVFERDGQTFVAIDTAGVRKKKSHEDAIDFFSDARSHKSIRRADVVVLLFDVTKKLSAIDKQLARYAVDHYKPVILGANKWDLVKDLTPDDFRAYIDDQLPTLSYAPVSFMSAREGKGVDETMRLALDLFEQAKLRVSTGELNRVLARALETRSPTSGGHAVRIRYATQAEVSPPTFVLFVNDKKHFSKDYMRYLSNRIREDLPFKEVPVRLVLRDKDSAEEQRRSILNHTLRRGAWPLALLVCLSCLCACLSNQSKPEWISEDVTAQSERVLLEVTALALRKTGFPVGSGLEPGQLTATSGWMISLAPFRGKGFREQCEIRYTSKGSRQYTAEVRVKRDKNDDLLHPLDLTYAAWVPIGDNTERAAMVMQYIKSLLGTEFTVGPKGGK